MEMLRVFILKSPFVALTFLLPRLKITFKDKSDQKLAQIKMSGQNQASPKATSVFNELRLEEKLIDAVIKIQDVEFPVHKIILCSCAPYFRSLFTRWSTPDQKVFQISIMSPVIMRIILDYTYTGSLSVTESNVQELMTAADMIDTLEIIQLCSDFLMNTMCSRNCIGMWKFCSTIAHAKLSNSAYQFILKHFEEVAFSDEFLQLSMEELADIISEDGLLLQHESFVYESVMRWIDHGPERERHIAALLSKVRLAILSSAYLRNNVLSNKWVKSNDACLRMISIADRLKCQMITTRPFLIGFHNLCARPRLPASILLTFGGFSSTDPTNPPFEAYDIRTDRWISLENNERTCAYHGTAFINGYIYCIGGFDRSEHFNRVRRFDPVTNTWQEKAPMHFRRSYVSVTMLNGCIYALGGCDGRIQLNTAECYRPEANQWSRIASMHHHRSDASCTAFQDKIYVCGGFDDQDYLQSAEYYSPQTNQWTMIAPMNSPHSGVGVIAYAGCVYAVGGFDGNEHLRTAEAYNPQTNTWANVSPMLTQRSNFGIEVVEDRLFVVGGFNGVAAISQVEFYNAATNEWTKACDMGVSRNALSCCVIYGLPNMADYAFPREALPLVVLEEEECASEGSCATGTTQK